MPIAGPPVVVEADGGSRGNPGPAGYGALVRHAVTGEVLAERAAGLGVATNNVAEYRGLIAGLAAAVELAPAAVEVRMDSKLVVEQMAGRWQIKHPSMRPLASQAAALVAQLPAVTWTWVPRARNGDADRLANQAMDGETVEWGPAGAGRAGPEQVREVPAGAQQRLPGWMAPPQPAVPALLVRHGQTALSIERRFSGRSDPGLTELGQAQAAALARAPALAGVSRIVSSPLRRAQQTAAAIAVVLGISVQVDDGLRETDFGEWEGSTFAEVQARWPAELDAWLADPAVAPPGGESFVQTSARVQQARARLQAGAGEVIVVSHVSPIKELTREAVLAPLAALYRLHLDLASITVIDYYPDGPAVLRRFNDTSHLTGQLTP